MHLDDGVLEALLDGELDATADAVAQRHLETCNECRARFEALRRDAAVLQHALAALDHARSRIPVAAVVARATRHESRHRAMRWAAVLALVVLGAGALYAVPASPLRRWVDRLLRKRVSVVTPTDTTSSASGVALQPGQAHFRIVLAEPASGVVTITLTDGPAVDARRTSGAARFVAEIDGLRIEPTSAQAEFVIGIPRSAPWVEVMARGQRVFLKDGSRIITHIPPDSLGRYVVTLTTP